MFIFLTFVNSTEEGNICRPPQLGALVGFYFFFSAFFIHPRTAGSERREKELSLGGCRGQGVSSIWAAEEDEKWEKKEEESWAGGFEGEWYVWRERNIARRFSLVSWALEVDFKASEAEQGFRGEGYYQV